MRSTQNFKQDELWFKIWNLIEVVYTIHDIDLANKCLDVSFASGIYGLIMGYKEVYFPNFPLRDDYPEINDPWDLHGKRFDEGENEVDR